MIHTIPNILYTKGGKQRQKRLEIIRKEKKWGEVAIMPVFQSRDIIC